MTALLMAIAFVGVYLGGLLAMALIAQPIPWPLPLVLAALCGVVVGIRQWARS